MTEGLSAGISSGLCGFAAVASGCPENQQANGMWNKLVWGAEASSAGSFIIIRGKLSHEDVFFTAVEMFVQCLLKCQSRLGGWLSSSMSCRSAIPTVPTMLR